ncbi:MAG: glycerate kinase [Nitrososphaerota archaeon]|nr:glycerate kinase [Nitrososphaerota archaeon]MDG6939158.1 glycerate kinase [Nitrososphaerota archaeon]
MAPDDLPVKVRVEGAIRRSPLAKDAVLSLGSFLRAADPAAMLRRRVKVKGGRLFVGRESFGMPGRVLVVGGGKAGARMALGLEGLLGDRITAGIVNVPDGPWREGRRVRLNPARHPVPDGRGVEGVKSMLRLVGRPDPDDLVICLISGGGSSLMPMPAAGVGLSDKREVTELLLKSGADIQETNAVRKHISGIKGGRLAQRLYPATVVSLIISDVVGDRLDTVASGPTVPDGSTLSDVAAVFDRYSLWEKVPASVRKLVLGGSGGETPKPGAEFFGRVHNFLLGGNAEACSAAAKTLKRRGYDALVLSTQMKGEARLVGSALGRSLKSRTGRPAALVAGGETTVKVRGRGTGGRNQELALAAAIALQGTDGAVLASMGSDGIDGPTDAAGALVDGGTVARGRRRGMDAVASLDDNDSHAFFKRVGGLILTGPTGTNVNDVVVALTRPPSARLRRGAPPTVRRA